ncbi:flagellar hook-length control protein FliK, partial [Klebsiella pneumoniae]|uniref:flagellar hook-length control protein FliK n=1 Tax=Klebsiella pneumoniae TaxID=573 RepID=UPI003851DBC2
GNESADPATRAWRARFTLNVEPAGPVHALITLSGDKTFVRMWAERPATAQQLRDGVAELSQALARAELKPGDILVREGTPPQPAPPR